jgi:hypothetical protein
MSVFVLDKRKRPLMPCSERCARVLLERGRAVVHRHQPFTIQLRDRVGGETQPVEIRVDPGSKGTGIAVVRVLAQAKRPLRDAAAMNATRHAVCDEISVRTGLPVSRSSGGRTKWNRTRAGLAKTHANDAVCVGPTDRVTGAVGPTLLITCAGRGTRQRIMPNAYGFTRGHRPRRKLAFGFRTGDLVRAEVPSGRKAGVHTGRVAIRTTGSFNVQTPAGTVQGVSHRHCRLLQRGDGYGYGYAQEVQP